jgi:adenylate cyclase
MIWARPAGASAAPLAVLGGAVFLLLFNPFGLEAGLARLLVAAFGDIAPRHPAPHALMPLRLGEILWLLGFGGGAIALLRSGLLGPGLLVLGGTACGTWLAWLLFVRFGLLFDAATAGLCLLLLFAVMAGARALTFWLARLNLRLAFADSLPHASIERIVRHPELLRTDGEMRECSYLVCGLRGLAALGAGFRDDPAAFTRLTSRALSPLMDQVLAHGGTIDRLTADGFAAFWNAPLDDPSHANHACEAANGMAIQAARVNEALAGQARANGDPMPLIEIGVGVATGKVIAGAFGGMARMGYSVHGEAVSLAARIQALSREYGPAVIVSEATREAAERSFAFLEVDTVAASTGDPPVTLFALVGSPVLKASPKFRALTTFHDHIFQALRKQQWRQARALIEQCRRLSGASPRLYDLHLNRIVYYENSPPGENWDGAFRPILK